MITTPSHLAELSVWLNFGGLLGVCFVGSLTVVWVIRQLRGPRA